MSNDRELPSDELIAQWVRESNGMTAGNAPHGRYIIRKYQEWANQSRAAGEAVKPKCSWCDDTGIRSIAGVGETDCSYCDWASAPEPAQQPPSPPSLSGLKELDAWIKKTELGAYEASREFRDIAVIPSDEVREYFVALIAQIEGMNARAML